MNTIHVYIAGVIFVLAVIGLVVFLMRGNGDSDGTTEVSAKRAPVLKTRKTVVRTKNTPVLKNRKTVVLGSKTKVVSLPNPKSDCNTLRRICRTIGGPNKEDCTKKGGDDCFFVPGNQEGDDMSTWTTAKCDMNC